MLPLATSLMQAQANSRRADAQNSQNKANAEANRYSPWTNQHYDYNRNYTPSALEGAVGGGVQGLGILQGLEKGFGGSEAPMSGQQKANLDSLTSQTSSTPWWTQSNFAGPNRKNV
jgi:hypothetical protein